MVQRVENERLATILEAAQTLVGAALVQLETNGLEYEDDAAKMAEAVCTSMQAVLLAGAKAGGDLEASVEAAARGLGVQVGANLPTEEAMGIWATIIMRSVTLGLRTGLDQAVLRQPAGHA